MTTAPRSPSDRRPRAWVLALLTLVTGPGALSLTFAVGEGGGRGPGASTSFVLSSLFLAAIWTLGGLAVIRAGGPDRSVRTVSRGRSAALALGAGAAFAAACLLGGLVLHALEATRPWVGAALDTAQAAPAPVVLLVALVAGAGEEVFFRLGLPRLLRGPARWALPVALYALATVATGNPALVLVAVPLGLVATWAWTATGRWTSPLIVHALWSLAMVGLFPQLVS